MFSGTAQVSQVSVFFFVSTVCLLVPVTMVNKNKAVVCCLLATSAITLSEKKQRKSEMWSKKWYLKRNTGLFISPSGISDLDSATTKTDTAERSISIGRESLQVFFFVLGALAYFQVPPLGGSRD